MANETNTHKSVNLEKRVFELEKNLLILTRLFDSVLDNISSDQKIIRLQAELDAERDKNAALEAQMQKVVEYEQKQDENFWRDMIGGKANELADPKPVNTQRYWIIKSRKTKEYFYLRCYKPHLICEPTWINDVLCVSGVTHATLVPEYLGMQMQIEYKGNFDLDFEVTVVENSVEQDESDVFFFDTLQVVSTDKNPEEFAARWMSMTKKYDKEGQPHYRYRESAIVDGKKKVVFEKKFPAPMMMPTLPMHNENNS